jgi:hypothetical protein
MISQVIIAAFAVYRFIRFWELEEGPWRIAVRFRKKIGITETYNRNPTTGIREWQVETSTAFARWFDCHWCVGLPASLVAAVLLFWTRDVTVLSLAGYWLAIAGLAGWMREKE